MIHASIVRLAILTALLLCSAAEARTFTVVNTDRIAAAPVDVSDPLFPGSGFRTGQEGWVRVNFVVTAQGRTADAIVIDSVGGASFERAALDAIEDWTFEPGTEDIPYNVADIRFELDRGRDAATSNFLRRYRRIMTHVLQEETEFARTQVDAAVRIGGWNLYEEVMLDLMVGRVEGLEGKTAEKLEHYNRAIAQANRRTLDGKDRIDALSRVFEMQHFFGQYGSAMLTLAELKREPGGGSAAEALEPKAAEIRTALASDTPFTASGQIYNPCNCDDGHPLWRYRPARREFSFANVSGNVESFEVRCQSTRLQGNVNTTERWTLPDSPRACEIYVFGADGASFELIEHGSGATSEAVATSDVVDR